MGSKVLVIGYGNPGRLDDGLGPALAEALAARAIPGLTVDADYQLVVEDAAAVAAFDVVIFADAAVEGREPFGFRPVEPGGELSFSSHSCEPEAVMAMAQRLFQANTRGYALGIRGYTFNEFGEGLSAAARDNLEAALAFVDGVIRNELFDDAAQAMREEQPARRAACSEATSK